jgi:putative ABC transport system permease protein
MTAMVAAGVLNTALMSVFERTREIGTLRAVGARRTRVMRLFLAEAGALAVFASAAGGLLGAAVVAALGRVGIPAFSEAQRYSYGGDFLYPVVNWTDVATMPLVMLLVCVAAAVGPAVVAARMRPADALRYV